MKKVVIFGAAGHTGTYITRKMMSEQDVELSVFVRNPAKFGDMDLTGVNVIQGDAMNAADVKTAMDGQDVLLCSLEGDVRAMAQNIVNALAETSVKRIIWITGMGIHHEIKGIHGKMLDMYAKKRPDYIEAADLIVVVCAVFLRPLLGILGADEGLMPYCVSYMIPVLISMPFAIFGTMLSMSYITVGKANLGLIMSLLGGVINIALDWLFLAVFHWGIEGAAIATSIGYATTSVIGVIYFCVHREHEICVVKPKWRARSIIQSCTNGASEMIGVFAGSIVAILFNNILMRIAGADGVASITIMLYVQSLFNAVYRGYSMGIAPVISYNFGKSDTDRLKLIHTLSMRLIIVASVVLTVINLLLAPYMVRFFAGSNQAVYEMALHGFRIFAISCLMTGVNVYASALFTALNDGKTSAILSFFRTVVFLVVPVLILPVLFGIDGVWIALPVGELLALIMSIICFRKLKFRKM